MDPFVQTLNDYGVQLLDGTERLALTNTRSLFKPEFDAEQNLSVLMNEEHFATIIDAELFCKKMNIPTEYGDIPEFFGDIMSIQTDNHLKRIYLSPDDCHESKYSFIKKHLKTNKHLYQNRFKEFHMKSLFGCVEPTDEMINEIYDEITYFVNYSNLLNNRTVFYSDLLKAVEQTLCIKK